MDYFDYSLIPLKDREIRILELLPSASPSSSVLLRISPAHIDDLPHFSALSYAWGQGTGTAEIDINDRWLLITKSLETALKALRSYEESEYFWIDQISINQKDNGEKSRQIPLMGDIYSRSAQTIGWLGEETSHSGNAMTYLQDVGAKAHKLGLADLDYDKFALLLAEQADLDEGMVHSEGAKKTEAGRNDTSTAGDEGVVAAAAESTQAAATVHEPLREEVDALIKAQGSLIQHFALEGMIELCTLPYFTRGWIQQEIAMPKTLTFQWGSQTINADVFAAAVQFHLIFVNRKLLEEFKPIIMNDPTDIGLFNRIRSASMWSYMQPSLVLRRINHSSERGKRLTTARVLERLRRVQFSHAQDRVYGILGIVSDGGNLDIKVDVGADTNTLYTHVARKIVDAPVTDEQSVEGINFLTMINPAQGKASNLPSWVPDLTCMSMFETLANSTTALAKPYHASTGQKHEPRTTQSVDRLGCLGVIVDAITTLGPAWEVEPTGERKHKAGLTVLSSIEDFAQRSQNIVSSNAASKHPFRTDHNRLVEAQWRVPVLNRESIGNTVAAREATSGWSETGWELVKYTMLYDMHIHDIYKIISEVPLTDAEKAQLSQFNETDRPLEDARLKMSKNYAFNQRPEHATYQVLLDALKERMPFLGANGFVGIGPLTMQPGDLVCVLYGGSFPFILRRTDESGVYNLVGEAYCDGIMAGEAFHMDLPVHKLVLYFQRDTALGAYYHQRCFSQAVVLPPNARLIIASGPPGFSEELKVIVPSSPRDQIEACYDNCDLALKTAGVEKSLLAAHNVHVFLTNVEDIPLVMPVWKEKYGEDRRPAWMMIAGPKFVVRRCQSGYCR